MSAGYDFVRLPDAPRRVARPQARFDRRLEGKIFGRIAITYVAEQPIHVGAGHKVIIEGKPVRAQMRRGADAIVAAASCKGIARARFEAIARACVPGKAPRPQNNLTSRSYPGYAAALHPSMAHQPVFTQCETRTGDPEPVVCPACALFGLMSRRSRIGFGDLIADRAPTVHRMAQQFGPRLHHLAAPTDVQVDDNQRKLTVRALRGRKFHGGSGPPPVGEPMLVEAIPPGARLAGEVRLFNVTPDELGGVLVALGFACSSYARLDSGEPAYGTYVKAGGGKNLGFGRLRPDAIGFTLTDHRGRATPAAPADWQAAWEASDDRWPAGEDALVGLHLRGGW